MSHFVVNELAVYKKIFLKELKLEKMFIVFFVIIAAIIFLIVYISQPRTELGLRNEFNNFIEEELRENFCLRGAQEIDLTEPIKLDKRTQLVIFGIDHFQAIHSPWALYLVTDKNICNQFKPTFKNKFWLQHFTTLPERDAIRILDSFEIQEIIWSEKETISARAFILPHSGSREDSNRNVHFLTQTNN